MEILKFLGDTTSSIKSGRASINKDNRYCLRLVAHRLSSSPLVEDILSDLAKASKEFSEIKINDSSTKDKVSKIAKDIANFTKNVTDAYLTKNISSASKEPSALYYFPMPVELHESYSQTYEDSSINLEQRMRQWGYGKVINMLKNVGAKIPILGKSSAGMADTIETLKDFTSTLLKRNNILIDPNILSVYKSSVPRSFSFTFELVPRNQKEAKEYMNNIDDLRKKTMASLKIIKKTKDISINYLSIDYVFTFDIIDPYGSTDYSIISKLSKMLGGSRVLTEGFNINSVSCNINKDGIVTNYDGSPKVIEVTMELEERKPLWKSDWDNYINNINQ